MRLLYILLFTASLFAGEWTINDFTIRGKQFTQSATGILQGNLNRIPSYRAPKGDELLLRRRLDMDNYGLYVGKAEASAYTNLSRFTKPAGMSMDKLLKMKFFKDETPTGYNDVADIYFQGEYIYVKNLVRIFYKENGSWKSLEVAQGAKPGVLEISSTPSGATVTIDGVIKGKTPYSFVMDAPTVEVEVSKSGYYSQSFTADAKPGAVKKFSSSLKKRVTFSSNVEPEKMLDTTIQDIDQALELLRSIEGVYKKEKGRESTALAEFEKSFPKLEPQGEFEYDHEFAKRKAEYDDKKQKALGDAKINAAAFNSTISQMNEHIDQLSAKLYDLYLPVNSMKLGRYEINQNRFPVTLSINQGAFQFTYKGYLMMDRDVAKLFKFSSGEKGLKLQYSKRKVKVAGKAYYIRYGGMNIPFQGKVYELSGDLTLPSSVANSKEVLAYLDKVQRLEKVRKEKERQEQIRKEKERQEEYRKENERFVHLTRGMKRIPGGTFMMGSEDGYIAEKPVHEVTVSGFWMDSIEVSRAEFKRLMGWLQPLADNNYQRAMSHADWYDAVRYCNERSKEAGLDTVYVFEFKDAKNPWNAKLKDLKINYSANGYRLPTEAEWEYAYRAGTTTRFYWGDQIDDRYVQVWSGGNWMNNPNYHVQVGAMKLPNRFGLYDMPSNVAEWCNDYYSKYKKSTAIDPIGPESGNKRVVRGGDFTNGLEKNLSASYRWQGSPRTEHHGFRCVLPIQESN